MSIQQVFDEIEAHILANSHGHVWQKTEDGSVNWFGTAYGTHNGPICELCGYGFCEFCQSEPDTDCPYSTTAANLNPTDLYELEQT